MTRTEHFARLVAAHGNLYAEAVQLQCIFLDAIQSISGSDAALRQQSVRIASAKLIGSITGFGSAIIIRDAQHIINSTQLPEILNA